MHCADSLPQFSCIFFPFFPNLLKMLPAIDVASSLGIAAYAIELEFDFLLMLLQAISLEGSFDYIDDEALASGPHTNSPPPLVPSPLSSPPCSQPSSLPPSMPAISKPALSNTRKRQIAQGKAQSKRNKKRQ